VTDDDAVAARIRLMRDHGRGGHGGEVLMWGRNSRLDNLQAAVMLVKLRYYSAEIGRRRELATRYHQALKQISQLMLPLPRTLIAITTMFSRITKLKRSAGMNCAPISNAKGSRPSSSGREGRAPICGAGPRGITSTHGLALTRCLLLPLNTSLSNDEVDYICTQIRGFYRN